MQRSYVTTKNVAPGDRLDYWNNHIQSLFPGMTVSSNRDHRSSWSSCTLGDLNVALAVSQKALVQRWQTRPADLDGQRTILHLQSHGASLTSNEHGAALTHAGDLTFCKSTTPYEINLSDHNNMIVIDFPADFLGVDAPSGCLCSGKAKSVRRLHDFALSILDDDFDDFHEEEDAEECIRNVFQTLIHDCIDARISTENEDLVDGQRIFDFIDHSIQDHALQTSMIAQRLSISTKRVQRIFATIGMTPSQYILKKRVNLAAMMLRSASFDGTVTHLAMDVGFSDTAHLCRSFRRFFGMTPKEYASMFQRRS